MKPVIEPKQDAETIASDVSMVREALPVTQYDPTSRVVGDEQQKKENPIMSVLGVFENNPEFDALMEDIYEARKQLNKEES